MDDLFGTGETEMEQRVLPRLRKDFRWCSEDRNDVTFTRQRIRWKKDLQSGSCIEVRRERPKELEEIPAERNTKENLYCTPACWDSCCRVGHSFSVAISLPDVLLRQLLQQLVM